ncbi:MAG: HAD family phosphatase [Kiritimatiellales bacterium]|nr:HAD family phosphatase [Kiritimatiellales bacterium]
MKLCNFDAFILDLDGTLIDSGKYHAQAFADAVLEQSGYLLDPGEYHEFFGKHSTWFAEILNDRHGLQLEPEKVRERKRERIQENFVAELFCGAREFLDFWHGKKPMALASNSPLSFVQPALEEADVMKYFDCITTADHVSRRKPDPEMIEVTIQQLQVDPLKTLVFEDQVIGIEAARAAGAQVVAVDNGQLVEFPVDIAVHTWAELLAFSESP